MSTGHILAADKDGVYVLKFTGDVRLTLCSTLDAFLDKMFADPDFLTVLIDLTGAKGIDSTSLGFLAKISLKAKEKYNVVPTIVSINDDITRLLLSMGFDRVFVIVKESIDESGDSLSELPILQTTEDDMRQKVIDAHRVLMSLNQQNKETFQDLVATLEKSASSGSSSLP